MVSIGFSQDESEPNFCRSVTCPRRVTIKFRRLVSFDASCTSNSFYWKCECRWCDRGKTMSLRVRHCVECPRCHTWYVIGFSPYRNGAHIVRTGEGIGEQYTLYCLCEAAAVPNRWRWREVKTCEVSKAAHHRGYGSHDEIRPLTRRLGGESWLGIHRINVRPSQS